MKKLALGILILTGLLGCAQEPIQLPNNVRTISMGLAKQTQIDTVDKSFDASQNVDFAKVKLCLVDNVQNENVNLKDSSGSIIGNRAGQYYEKTNTQNIASANLIKYLDESTKTIVVTGNTRTPPSFIVDIVKYDLKVQQQDQHFKVVFQNILRAQQDTGTISNRGFNPVGTWSGARAPKIISALDVVANKFENCIKN